MGSTIAMYTGLSGLTANARNLDVIGNNIANVNTTAFKSTRMLFGTQFSRNFNLGSVPSDVNGGTNPMQIGLGVTVAGTQRNFNVGSLSATGNSGDMAIAGDGFFIVDRGPNRLYTRAGAFSQNTNKELVNIGGARLMGYSVDATYQIDRTALNPIRIPVGELRIAEATQNVNFSGNLNASGALGNAGSQIRFGAFSETPGPIAAASLLTNLDVDAATAGVQGLAVGDQIQLKDVKKGNVSLPQDTFTVAAGTTLQDLMTWMEMKFGIITGTPNPDGTSPGVTLNAGTGEVNIIGNTGTANDIVIGGANGSALQTASGFRLLPTGGGSPTTPFKAQKLGTSDGESIRTSIQVYDSLGTPVKVFTTMTLVSKTPGVGTTWRYDVEVPQGAALDPRVASGTVAFDDNGAFINTGSNTAAVSRTGTGATDPLTFNINFGSTTALDPNSSNSLSVFAGRDQDGSSMGTLTSFAIGGDGIITGAFTNGLTRTIGQVAIATFSNPEGLVDAGQNQFGVGANSGNPIVTNPGELGTGNLVGGSLELSNVDLAQEFINLIVSSTGYSAASRVISTSDQLLQQLMVIGRG